MFVFVLDGALFRFNENTPAFEALFQFPPRMAALLLLCGLSTFAP